ncbi:TPA: helix-turn-helix transcriptional regulator [Vibrio parahaemolyticus]|nr:helix-turn-helix transcriptional regulator [Vibrio parahaemolyticus]
MMSAKDMFYPKSIEFSDADERAFAREELVYNVTEDLLVIMEDMGITKSELSRRLGKSKSYMTQILSGSRNMTLGSFSDICFALGFKPEVKLPVQEQKDEVHYDCGLESYARQKHIKKINIKNNIYTPEIASWENVQAA